MFSSVIEETRHNSIRQCNKFATENDNPLNFVSSRISRHIFNNIAAGKISEYLNEIVFTGKNGFFLTVNRVLQRFIHRTRSCGMLVHDTAIQYV